MRQAQDTTGYPLGVGTGYGWSVIALTGTRLRLDIGSSRGRGAVAERSGLKCFSALYIEKHGKGVF